MKTKKIKKEKAEFDLGKMPIKDAFIKIFIPTMISTLIAGTFVVFDTIFVSHGFHPGKIGGGIWYFNSGNYASLGATGISYVMPYTIIMVAISMMIGGGIGASILKAKASGDNNKAKDYMNSHLPMSLYYGLFISVFIIIFAKVLIWAGTGFQKEYIDNWFNNPLMNKNWSYDGEEGSSLMKNPEVLGHLLSQAAWYLRIQGLAAFPYVYMNGSGLILRVEGKTHIATRVNLIALTTNIVLDVLLINVFGLNLVGAALGTVIAEIIGMSYYLWYFKYKFPINANKPNWAFAKTKFGTISKRGTSNLGMQLNSALIILIFTFSIGVINYGNLVVINGYTSAFQSFFGIYLLASFIVNGIMISSAPIVNYNMHLNQIDRSLEAKRISFKVAVIFAGIFSAVVFVFPTIITLLFNSMPDSKAYPERISQILVLGFTFQSIIIIAGLYFQAIGENKTSSVLLYGKPLLLFILVLFLGLIFHATGDFGAWKNYFLGHNIKPIDGQIYSIGLFWAMPIVDIILGGLALNLLIKDTKSMKLESKKYPNQNAI